MDQIRLGLPNEASNPSIFSRQSLGNEHQELPHYILLTLVWYQLTQI